MPTRTRIDQNTFRRILLRNIALPLAVGVATAVTFVGLVFYLLSAINWVEHSERVIGNTQEIARLVGDKESALRGYLLTGDEAFLAPYETAKPKLLAQIDSLAKLVDDNTPQVDRMIRIRALQVQWDKVAESLVQARRDNGDATALVKARRGSAEREETSRELDTFLSIEQTLRLERVASARSLTTATVTIFLIISLSLSALLAWFGRRELMQLSGAYDAALREQEAQSEILQQQTWLRTGQTLLGDRIVGQQSLPALCQAMLDFLAEYLNASMATFYVRDKQGVLHRTAAFGSGVADGAKNTLAGTDSLTGQAVASRRLMCIQNVPPTYWKVNSGLGEVVPSSLAVLPIENEGVINGAVELGLMHDISERDKEFLKIVALNIGGYVEAAQYRERLQLALEETQQLNEELQVQQEELRTANEELEQQTAALVQSRAFLANQKAELEQANDHLSEQAHALDEKNSALNLAQAELEQRAADLQRASRYKSEFLANMSHELRTPLNSSLILSKLLADNKAGNLSAEQVKYATTIYSAGNDLLNLINDILDLSKVEAGKLDLQIEEISLAMTLESLGLTFDPMARQKHLQFVINTEPGTPASIRTDERRLEQILKNLLSNAIKFTDSGTVSLTLDASGEDAVRFTIRDSGIGIAETHLESIFEAFQQVDGTTSRQYGGTGLGLSISRNLATLLGGTITATSTPGVGSAFSLTLPLRAGEVVTADPGGTVDLEPRLTLAQVAATDVTPAQDNLDPASENDGYLIEDDRNIAAAGERLVLVIEDDAEFAHILLDLAHELRYRCIVAGTGANGLHLTEKHQPAAVLLDIGLPDLSGLAVLQELKSNPRTRHIPVHVISAYDRNETALQLGAIGYAVKPTTREELTGIFQRLEEKSNQKVKHVLVVEDDARQRDSIVQLISDANVIVHAVDSGAEALEALKATIFDCMIVDLKLPDMQGGELLKRMTGTDSHSFPPVIVYTGRSLSGDEEAELMRYSQSIIIKGARSPERLLDEVTLFLHQVESSLSSERRAMLDVSRARDRALEGRKVLLVDDDIRNVFSLSSALEHQGMLVEIGRNGTEALEALEKHPDIDIVLMDIMMPGMDGLEATRQIRATPRLKKLPVIAITAKAMKDDEEQCLAAGASDYLAKPIDIDKLYSLLRVWMPRKERF
ncbi:response regulator [Paraburkholderia bryophila]|uniref:response regulator n=1 Tax=Paraburkholderia bryophila TaxID=420952 RepID=UPI00234A1E56|nr:response regulator [Paraburkholderia bryophila]WCM18281.1 response regulator [Paraburkholderia bryophila]